MLRLRFIANNIDQIALALEHVAKGDANNARFALMLIDNVVEITLHQIAKNVQAEAASYRYREKPYEHTKTLRDALGQKFEDKVKFAQEIGRLDSEVSESIKIFHSFRNEVYHIGVHHEAVLPAITKFYFKVACVFLDACVPSEISCVPGMISYTPGMGLPERARKYFRDQKYFTNAAGDYQEACRKLSESVAIVPSELAATLADHVDTVIEQQDMAIEMIATGGPKQSSRDEAVRDTVAWQIAWTGKGKKFAEEHGWTGRSMSDFLNWISTHYPNLLKHDPIPAWRNRSLNVRREKNPHRSLKKYRDFMVQTSDARAALYHAHGQVDEYIDDQIEIMRGR